MRRKLVPKRLRGASGKRVAWPAQTTRDKALILPTVGDGTEAGNGRLPAGRGERVDYSGPATDLSPPGPALDLTLGPDGFATVLAQATMTAPGGATAEDCRFGVVAAGQGFEVQLPSTAARRSRVRRPAREPSTRSRCPRSRPGT